DPQCYDLQLQRIPGNNGPPKSGILDTAKKRDLAVAVVEFPKGEDRANLGKSFYLQNPRHDRCRGKMSGKIVFVDRYLFNTYDSLARLQLYYLVDQQKGITVREDRLDRP